MKEENKSTVYNALIYIISCCLNGKKVDKELLSHLDLGSIYSTASSHSLIAIVATALEDAGIVSKRASEMKLNAVRKNMLFDSARAEILKEFEDRGIKYLPLKGVILKDMYPEVGLRQMADNDILFDAEYRSVVRDIFLKMGYDAKHYEIGNHDVYMKEPVLNFEMHVSLFSHPSLPLFNDYFASAFERAISDGKSSYGYAMTDEDFYIFMKAHEYKHYANSGTGLRSLVDIYVYLTSKKESLDFDYITSECKKIEISEYERVTREIALKVFEPEAARALVLADRGEGESPLSDYDVGFLADYINVSTYGSHKTYLSNLLTREKKNRNSSDAAAKIRYILSLIFPKMEYYETVHPGVSKKKYLIPFLWIKRSAIILVKRPGRTMKTVWEVMRAKVKK